MSSTTNIEINAAYVASWKENNPKLALLNIDGNYLTYQNQKINIGEIYMQDILLNPVLFQNMNQIDAKDLFEVIRLHVEAMEIKEKELEIKTRRLQNI